MINISDWTNDEIIRLIFAKGHITQRILLEKFNDICGEKIPQSTFSCKIQRNALKISELQKICKLLGYSIYIKEAD